MKSALRTQAVGVGLRPIHHDRFINNPPSSVDWIEVVSENYLPWPGNGFDPSILLLERFRLNLPVALHGVSMNLGSADELDLNYMRRLKMLIERIEPFVVSDHLAWTGVDGQNLHDLLPVPYTQEALETMVRKIEQAQMFLGRQLLIENPSTYLRFASNDMSETDFLNELIGRTGCGLLLDINNVYVNSVNHGHNPIDWLKKINTNSIGQIHLAGHSDLGGFLVDTHDAPVCDQVWEVYRWLMKNVDIKHVMIERDGHIPEWDDFEKELKRLGEIYDESDVSA